ncbi:MAG: hypothetical protein MI748_17785 [Opitutales bacterium]|nr:hypothetical protein [Opitutales bacterium]
MNSIEKKLKELENEEKRIADQKQKLIEEQKLVEEKQKQLASLFENSGYKTPKELVEALIEKYSIRVNSLSSATPGSKRTRTRITAEVRDTVKSEVAAGNTKMAVSKKLGISYVVVGKITKGDYDHLS